MKRALAALTVATALVACGGTEAPPEPGSVQLHVGSAPQSGAGFVEVQDGADVELVPGAQGGFHVWTSTRLTGTSGLLFVTREARQVDTGQLVLRAQRVALEVPDAALSEMWESPAALPSFMCPAPIGIRIYDQELAFSVELRDEDDNILADDHIVVMPRCPEGAQRDFCLDICDG